MSSFDTMRGAFAQFNQAPELKSQLLTARVFYIAQEIIKNLWSAEQAAYVRVQSFSGGKLVFLASVGAAAQAVRLQASAIQNAINHTMGAKVVHAIEVRQGVLG